MKFPVISLINRELSAETGSPCNTSAANGPNHRPQITTLSGLRGVCDNAAEDTSAKGLIYRQNGAGERIRTVDPNLGK